MIKVEELMKQYFVNKDKIKAIKSNRSDYMSSNEWECKNLSEGASYSCIEALKYEMGYETMCEKCNKRHQFHLELNKLSHQNSGILKSVRSLTINQP